MAGSKSKKKAEDDKKSTIKVISRNKRAYHEFDILDKWEAGIVLVGSEVKSLRNGKISLEQAFADLQNDEVWLLGCDIPEYIEANRFNHKSKRPRKLLLHSEEIRKISGKVQEKGLTLVPLQMYFNKGIAKLELGLARGRKLHDKRDAIKSKDTKRELDRMSKRNYRD
ncbi:SsrA-binding protein SmpB [bacterium]|nr:SsrA-binding protein SmpB [bacterium]